MHVHMYAIVNALIDIIKEILFRVTAVFYVYCGLLLSLSIRHKILLYLKKKKKKVERERERWRLVG